MEVARRKMPLGDKVGAALTLAACLLLLWDPADAITGGLEGLRIFGEIVLPSLLPFFVVSEILIGLGLVHFVGALVEPVMRPMFNVPGVGSFVWSMGLAAGYPMDAVITSKLRRAKDCTRVEGERLLAFTNTADPLFLLGAVAVGMFGLPAVAFHLATAHYASAIAVGVIFRFYGQADPGERAKNRAPLSSTRANSGYWSHAINELYRARKQDGRALGRLLADAMADSTQTLIRIGGFIMFFAALIQLMHSTGMLGWLGIPIAIPLRLLRWDPALTPGIVAGVLELDVGSAMVAAATVPLLQRLAVVSAIVGWSGFSVHGQVASIISRTDLRMGVYLKARLLHAVLAALFTVVLCWLCPPVTTAAAGLITSLAFRPFFRVAVAGAITAVTVLGGYACHLLSR